MLVEEAAVRSLTQFFASSLLALVAGTSNNCWGWDADHHIGRVTGNGTIFGTGPQFPGIPYPVIIMIMVAFIFGFILKKTRIGRYTYAVGSNEEAARLSGIKVDQVKIVSYVFCGLLSALVGIILASRMVTSQPNSAVGYELSAIAAAVIGGFGSLPGAILGGLIIGITEQLAQAYPGLVVEVRGKGLMAGLKIVPPVRDFVARLRDHRLLAALALVVDDRGRG